ncbi:MAG: ATP-binding cassette domain-containing protein [Spirochaetales bacterium]|nr:ATP-binding cassette domain-containing protein [Spirochaetales bacterium]
MTIQIKEASEHNLKNISAQFTDGLTVVTGVSGSGKSSLVFNTLYHESRRRFLEVFTNITSGLRLAPAKVKQLTGIGPSIAIGQDLLNRNPNSTLASASGLHPYLRLLFARFGEQVCENCGEKVKILTSDETAEQVYSLAEKEERKVYALLLNNAKGSHRTLLEMLEKEYGNDRLIVDGKPCHGTGLDRKKSHTIELYLDTVKKTSTISQIKKIIGQAVFLGSYTVILYSESARELLSFSNNCPSCGMLIERPEPKHFHMKCLYCRGTGCKACNNTGLFSLAMSVTWNGFIFPGLLNLSVEQAYQLFSTYHYPAPAEGLFREIIKKLDALTSVGLGYISLSRPSPDLSRGESQRVRIALAMGSKLADMLHILDEPTIGLHPADVARLMPVLRGLPGSVIFVEHDRIAAAFADHALDLGPGAGQKGGEILFSGTPDKLWKQKTPTGLYFSMQKKVPVPAKRTPPTDFITIVAAYCHNLKEITVKIPLKRLTVITGVSGSGKSTLVHHVLAASLDAGKPRGCSAIEGIRLKPIHVDQGPIGVNPRSNPATYSGLAPIIRDFFAQETGYSSSHFSFNRPGGACPVCNGMGATEVKMKYLPSDWIQCAACCGKRFNEQVLKQVISLKGKRYSIADVFDLEIEQAFSLFCQNPEIPDSFHRAMHPVLKAFTDIGLGYLTLGQPSPTLSGGEAQRVKLVKHLAAVSSRKNLIILDEPSTGLHPGDTGGHLVVLDRLVRADATIIVVEHNSDIIRAADWIIDLGPGAGPRGGSLLYQGPGADFFSSDASITAREIRNEKNLAPGKVNKGMMYKPSDFIEIKGARLHNLKNISLKIPKNKLTVITGISGSGKSTLLRDILETEAKRRFLETLSMYERQGIKESADADVDSVSGLGVPVFPGHERALYDRRATVGTVTECSFHLAVLFSFLGERTCPSCKAKMTRVDMKNNQERDSREEWFCPGCKSRTPVPGSRYFISSTYGAACTKCHGIGTINIPAPEKLIIHPEKPLLDGAMYSPGFFPAGYFGKEYNHGHYMLLAMGKKYDFDPFTTPWNKIPEAGQKAFLFGDTGPVDVVFYNKKGFSGKRSLVFHGFYSMCLDWDIGGTFCTIIACPECGGAKLRPEYLSVTLAGLSIHQISELPLSEVYKRLEKIKSNALKKRNADESHAILVRRLAFLTATGLGYISLNRNTLTLSAGEAQRIKLAGLTGSGLTGITILIDEPTRGLHPGEVNSLINILEDLRDAGNTLVVVEHDPLVMKAADYMVEFGPGSGDRGGRIVAWGPFDRVMNRNTITTAWLKGEKKIIVPHKRRKPVSWMTVKGAMAYNLKGDEVSIPLQTLTGICGVSGSGKSTLLLDTIGRALAPKKHTTSVSHEDISPGPYDEITGAPPETVTVDQSRAHITSPLSFLGMDQSLVNLYAKSSDAYALGIGKKELSRPCTSCKGHGIVVTKMGFMPDVRATCELCRGTGRTAEAWQVKLKGVSLPELYSFTIDHVFELFQDLPQLSEKLKVLQDVGLGYLVLRQPGYSLSGGEAQRLKIAKELMKKTPRHTLYILDEPSVGQHMEDLSRLTGVLRKLVDAGNTIVICEHHPHLLAACDWLCELGPGGGPDGGKVIASCTPEELARTNTPTAPYIKSVMEGSLC